MRLLFLLLLCFSVAFSFAQPSTSQNESYYVYDKDWRPCDIKKAVYLSYLEKLSDTAYQWYNYKFSGPLINVETYRDENTSILNGFLAYYDESGRMDSCGYASNGKRDRSWYFYDNSLKIILQKDYDQGRLIKVVDPQLEKKDRADTLAKGEIEAAFTGGDKAWKNYLERNLQYPQRAENLHAGGMVVINFTVYTDGSVQELFICKSIEFSLDMEAWHLIERSPKWEPASQNGRKVKAYRRQPITFASQ